MGERAGLGVDAGLRRTPCAVRDCPAGAGIQARNASLSLPSTDAPVKVMSVAEAEGSFFDAVVLLHATDANWPTDGEPHPLLSWTLQRTLKMPGSDPALTEREVPRDIEALLASSGTVICTYAKEDENGGLRPSPILKELGNETRSMQRSLTCTRTA